MKESRRAIVVGGAGGIGSDICRRLASDGCRVVIADRNLEGAQDVLSSLSGDGHEVVQLDVTNEAEIGSAFDSIEANSPASILVVASGGPVVPLGNAGIVAIGKSDWEKTITHNLTAVFCCVQKFAQLRMAKPLEQSRIVMIGSAAGQIAGSGMDIGYCTSKAALFGFSREVAFDLAGANVTVNVVAPGPVGTPEFYRHTTEEMRKGIASVSWFHRLATPEEVSAGVAYLVSPEAGYITGTILELNGGSHMP